MRLHEALNSKRFNVGLETAAQFLASRGIPLESKDVNARIRDFQASALSREFGYTYSSTPTPSPRRKNEETPEVKRILEEIKNKKNICKSLFTTCVFPVDVRHSIAKAISTAFRVLQHCLNTFQKLRQ